MKLSYEQLRQKLREALGEIGDAWIVDIYPDDFIFEVYNDGKSVYFRQGYTVDGMNVSLSGDRTEVEREVSYVPLQAAVRLSGAETKDSGDYGYKWRVCVVKFGPDINGTHWTKEPLVRALSKFEGAKVFMLTEAQHQAKLHPFGKPTTEIVGWLANAAAEADGIYADLMILKSSKQLRDALVDSWERGNPDLYGLSVDLAGRVNVKTVGGKKVRYLEEVMAVSVDVVYEPAAGGKFLRLAAARTTARKEDEMDREKLLAALKGARRSAYDKLVADGKLETVTVEEILTLLAAVPEGLEDLDGKIKGAVDTAVKAAVEAMKGAKAPEEGDDAVKAAKEILAEARITACGVALEQQLAASQLPEISQARLRKQFEKKEFKADELKAAISEEKEYLDKVTGSGRIEGAGQVQVVGSAELAVQMLDDFFDKKAMSIRAAYIKITGDANVTGDLRAAKNLAQIARLRGSVESTTWAEILGDSIARKVEKLYKEPTAWDLWKKIVAIVPLSDFRTNHRTRMGGYGDLATVAESGPYEPMSTPGDEEATYSATKRGGTEDVTLEAIKNDDVGAVRRIPVAMVRAAKRTLHKFVFDFLRTNPTIYDAVALFHASHGNLGSAALASAALTARRTAMLDQTEADSGEVLGIPPAFIVVPTELQKTAYDLVTPPKSSDFTPTSADFLRTLNMEVLPVPDWTDATDWCLVANPEDIECIEIGFLDGKEEPEIFVQDMPNAGSMFSHDKLTYKIRHIYGGTVKDYRGLDKSVVAG